MPTRPTAETIRRYQQKKKQKCSAATTTTITHSKSDETAPAPKAAAPMKSIVKEATNIVGSDAKVSLKCQVIPDAPVEDTIQYSTPLKLITTEHIRLKLVSAPTTTLEKDLPDATPSSRGMKQRKGRRKPVCASVLPGPFPASAATSILCTGKRSDPLPFKAPPAVASAASTSKRPLTPPEEPRPQTLKEINDIKDAIKEALVQLSATPANASDNGPPPTKRRKHIKPRLPDMIRTETLSTSMTTPPTSPDTLPPFSSMNTRSSHSRTSNPRPPRNISDGGLPTPIQSPTSPTSRPAPSIRPPRLRLDVTKLGSTQVLLRDGLSIDCITTHEEPRKLIINGCPANLAQGDLESYLSVYGKITYISHITPAVSGGGTIRVSFAQHREAVAAMQACKNRLVGYALRLDACWDTSYDNKSQGTNVVADTVILRWNIPPQRVKLFYRVPQKAAYMVEEIRGRSWGPRKLDATLREAPRGDPTQPRRVVLVTGVCHGEDLDELGERMESDDRPVFLDNSYDHKAVMEELSALVRSTPGLRGLGITEGDHAVTFHCNFRSSESAAAFGDKLQNHSMPWRGSAQLQITHRIEILYIISEALHCAVRKELDLIAARFKGQATLKETTPAALQVIRHIRLCGWVREAKKEVDALLAGEVLRAKDGSVVWEQPIHDLYGATILLGLDLDGVYVHADYRRGKYTLYGSEHRRKKAAKLLRDHINTIKRELRVHAFPRRQVRFWERRGLETIRSQSKAALISLDVGQCWIMVRGDAKAHQALDRAIGDIAQIQAKDASVKPSTSDCPACLQPVERRFELKICGHVYCRPCLTNYLSSAARHGSSFPLTCFGNEGACKKEIPISVFTKLLAPAVLAEATDRAFDSYIRSRPSEFRYCATPDCAQIYRVKAESASRDEKTAIQCPGCLARTCCACHHRAHDGRTCQERRNDIETGILEDQRLLEKWMEENGGHRCMKCKAPITKIDGCNHVQCQNCNSHMCWVCGEVFPDVGTKSVYQHMNEKHDGLYTTPVRRHEPPTSSAPSSSTNTASSSSTNAVSSSKERSKAKIITAGKGKKRTQKDPTWRPAHLALGFGHSQYNWQGLDDDEWYGSRAEDDWRDYGEFEDFGIDGESIY